MLNWSLDKIEKQHPLLWEFSWNTRVIESHCSLGYIKYAICFLLALHFQRVPAYKYKFADSERGKVQQRWFFFSANEVKLLNNQGKRCYQIDYVPAPRITEADKTNDRKSLQRALDRRLYLLLYGDSNGAPSGNPVWHFPENVYDSQDIYLQCAKSALESVLGGLSHTYFVGNAPMGHMVIKPKENVPEPYELFQRFFLKRQVIDTNKFNIRKCEEYF
ncbi:39S ribosomal protein L46, mitochondrial-like [Hibiscus syriacus]|uniref:39S ribosomal protein L46, mitochondrial-like n=1 Tax=Hibiscus syriacus TaxID=106335 RepID=UPI0019213405|nr:39S ribosomal protein L46, mitochondrial-like [Hibiscus syriacus]